MQPCLKLKWSTLLLVALQAGGLGSVRAQWAQLPIEALPRPPLQSVYTQAFHVLAMSNDHLHAFSGMSPRWVDLGSPHTDPGVAAPPVATGDWTGLVRLSRHRYRAYSARRHASADISFFEDPDQLTVCVEDDIILILGTRQSSGVFEACGYSTQTNAWACEPMAGRVLDYACSRFVAGVIRGDNQAFGFSARRGEWVPTPCGSGSTVAADGNVLLVNLAPPAPVQVFSGVRGEWTISPAQHATSVAMIDHNVAFIRADSALGARRSAYSAYSGAFVTGSVLAGTVRLTDNLVIVEQAGSAGLPTSIGACGARPGAWSLLTLPRGTSYAITSDADWAIVEDRTARVEYAVSGVCGGTWQAQASSGVLTFPGFPRCTMAVDGVTARAFSGPSGTWAPPAILGSGLYMAMPGGAAFYSATVRVAFSARHGQWVSSTRSESPSSFLTAGAFVADYAQPSGQLTLWHERRNNWITFPVTTGGPLTASTSSTNVMILDFTGIDQGVVGVSGQRGDAAAAGAMTLPIVERRADENVGWVRDSANVLHAFASPNATHSLFQYPLDSEFQAITDPAVVPGKTIIRANPGDAAYLIVGLPLSPPAPIAGIGTLFCSPLIVPYAGILGSDGLLPPYALPIPGVPSCLELCLQGLTVGASGVQLIGSTDERARYH